jgi:hypothetical protein
LRHLFEGRDRHRSRHVVPSRDCYDQHPNKSQAQEWKGELVASNLDGIRPRLKAVRDEVAYERVVHHSHHCDEKEQGQPIPDISCCGQSIDLPTLDSGGWSPFRSSSCEMSAGSDWATLKAFLDIAGQSVICMFGPRSHQTFMICKAYSSLQFGSV